MSEKNGMVFRNAIGGYNKSDVNTYLAAVAAEAKSKEEMSEMQISHLENDLADLKNENAVLSSKADELAIEAFSAALFPLDILCLTNKFVFSLNNIFHII